MTQRRNLQDDLFPWHESHQACFSVQLAAVPVPPATPPHHSAGYIQLVLIYK